MEIMKTHLAIAYTDPHTQERRTRSLCGRSSGLVWSVETIESGQNVAGADQVDCFFCLRLMASQKKLNAA